MSTWSRPRKASIAAPPVSPEVAPTMVRALAARRQHMVHQPRQELHRHVLEGERRAVEELEHEQVGAELHQRRHGGMAEGGVGLAHHAGEIGRGDRRRRRTAGSRRARPPHRAGRRSPRSRRGRASARPPAHRGRRRGRGPRASHRRSPSRRLRPGWRRGAKRQPSSPGAKPPGNKPLIFQDIRVGRPTGRPSRTNCDTYRKAASFTRKAAPCHSGAERSSEPESISTAQSIWLGASSRPYSRLEIPDPPALPALRNDERAQTAKTATRPAPARTR